MMNLRARWLKSWEKFKRGAIRVPDNEFVDERLRSLYIQDALLKRVSILVTGLTLVMVVALQYVALSNQGNVINEIRQTQQKGSPTLRAVQNVVDELKDVTVVIEDCLLETGECYNARLERNRAATRVVVSEALACRDDNPGASAEDILKCVEDGKLNPTPPKGN